jgi:molybdenum cofactor synthesis domain-containing protein
VNAPRAAILSVGDELVLGTTLDTNSRTLSSALREAGLDVVEHRTVADDQAAIAAAMRALASSVDILVSTGGLGPTDDDLTRDALNDLTDAGGPQVEDAVARTDLDAWFAGRGRTMAANNLRQALRPKSARIVRNLGGTAPGLAATLGTCRVFCLPGPPREMIPMFESDVLPAVRPAGAPAIAKRTLGTFGIGESALAERLGVVMDEHPRAGHLRGGVGAVPPGGDARLRPEEQEARVGRREVHAPVGVHDSEAVVPEGAVKGEGLLEVHHPGDVFDGVRAVVAVAVHRGGDVLRLDAEGALDGLVVLRKAATSKPGGDHGYVHRRGALVGHHRLVIEVDVDPLLAGREVDRGLVDRDDPHVARADEEPVGRAVVLLGAQAHRRVAREL